MKKITITLFGLLLGSLLVAQVPKKEMKSMIDEDLKFAANQYKVLMKLVPPTLMPRSFNAAKNELVTSDTKWWCSGFYPGTLWMIYDATKDESIKAEAIKRLGILEPTKYYTGNHVCLQKYLKT